MRRRTGLTILIAAALVAGACSDGGNELTSLDSATTTDTRPERQEADEIGDSEPSDGEPDATDAQDEARPETLTGGESSPERVIEELEVAIEGSDPLGLLAMMHPQERLLIKELYDSANGAADSTGAIDVDGLLAALEISLDLGTLQPERLADDVVYFTSSSATVSASLDAGRAQEAVVADLANFEGGTASAEFAPATDGLGIVVVEDQGNWYFSGLYTAAEITRRALRLPPRFVDTSPTAAAGSPEEAVAEFVAAVGSKDLRAIASTLTAFEARLVADYESTLGGELLAALNPLSINASPSTLNVVSSDDGIAVVEIDSWSLAVNGTIDNGYDINTIDFTVSASGLCGDATSYDSYDGTYNSGSGCAFAEPSQFDVGSVLADAGWRGPRLVVVNEGGNWAVSPARTVLGVIDPLTNDPITAVAAATTIDRLFGFYLTDGVDDAVLHGLAATLEAATGQSTTVSYGDGRVGIARVAAPATVTIGDATQSAYCQGRAIRLTEDAEYDGRVRCGETLDIISGEIALVLSSGYGLSGPAPLGPVAVNVSSLSRPVPVATEPFEVCVEEGDTVSLFDDPFGGGAVVEEITGYQCGLTVTAVVTPRDGTDRYEITTPSGATGYALYWLVTEL